MLKVKKRLSKRFCMHGLFLAIKNNFQFQDHKFICATRRNASFRWIIWFVMGEGR